LPEPAATVATNRTQQLRGDVLLSHEIDGSQGRSEAVAKSNAI
jgi:hypothetical protein